MLVPAPPPCGGYPGRPSWAILSFMARKYSEIPPEGLGSFARKLEQTDVWKCFIETKEAWSEYRQ